MPALAKILLVDDSPTDTKLVKLAVRNLRWLKILHSVEGGEEALKYLEDQSDPTLRPNLLLVDLNMPRMNGFELLDKLKSDERYRSLPIAVLTTSNAPKDIAEAYRRYASCFITKPPDFEGFQKALSVLEQFWTQVATLPEAQ